MRHLHVFALTAAAVLCAGAVQADPAHNRAELDRVHHGFYETLRYTRVGDYTPNARMGDCKTYTADEYVALARLGWPPEALHIVSVRTERNEPHAVLGVDMPDGGRVILDSRFADTETPETLRRYGYRFVAEQGGAFLLAYVVRP